MDLESLKIDIIAVSQLLGKRIHNGSIWIEDLGCPHEPPKKRKRNVSNVYIFMYENRVLKVGKADINSDARHSSHHYTPGGSTSSLYNSIKNSAGFMVLINKQDIGDWIKNNCRRIDIYINHEEDSFTLGMIESVLIYKLRPEFESRVERVL